MLARPACLLVAEKARLEPAQRHPRIGDAGAGRGVGSLAERRRKRPLQASVLLERAQAAHETLGILPLKGPVNEAFQPLQVPGIGMPDKRGRGTVHPVEQVVAGPQDALPVAPRQGRGEKPCNRPILLGLEPVRNAQRIVLEEVGPLETIGRLVQPVAPLREPGGGGFAAKRRWGCGHGVVNGAIRR